MRTNDTFCLWTWMTEWSDCLFFLLSHLCCLYDLEKYNCRMQPCIGWMWSQTQRETTKLLLSGVCIECRWNAGVNQWISRITFQTLFSVLHLQVPLHRLPSTAAAHYAGGQGSRGPDLGSGCGHHVSCRSGSNSWAGSLPLHGPHQRPQQHHPLVYVLWKLCQA